MSDKAGSGYPPQVTPTQGYPPNPSSVYPPTVQQGYPPSQSLGYPPSSSFGYPPSNNQGYPPSQSLGYPPSQGLGNPPTQSSGYSPNTGSGYPPTGNQGYPPIVNQGYPPKLSPGNSVNLAPGASQPSTSPLYPPPTSYPPTQASPGVLPPTQGYPPTSDQRSEHSHSQATSEKLVSSQVYPPQKDGYPPITGINSGPPLASNGGVLCWTKVVGRGLPSNAIQGGFEADGRPLFIARANYEGSLIVGKAATHLGGCLIPYGGQEVYAETYEVLTGEKGAIQ